jgi:hypothetical protein
MKKGIMLNVKKETIDESFGIENFKNIESSAFL